METSRYSIISRISNATLVFCLVFSSCQKESDQNQTTDDSYLVQIKDEFIVNSISDYVKEQNLDSTSTLLSINVKTDTYRTSLYISHTQDDLSQFDSMPGQYTMMDGFLVLVYSDIDKFIYRISAREKLIRIIREKRITLNTNKGINDTPTWKISKCEEHITKELETDELELPCFLKLANVNGELRIIEESWFKVLKDKIRSSWAARRAG